MNAFCVPNGTEFVITKASILFFNGQTLSTTDPAELADQLENALSKIDPDNHDQRFGYQRLNFSFQIKGMAFEISLDPLNEVVNSWQLAGGPYVEGEWSSPFGGWYTYPFADLSFPGENGYRQLRFLRAFMRCEKGILGVHQGWEHSGLAFFLHYLDAGICFRPQPGIIGYGEFHPVTGEMFWEEKVYTFKQIG